MAGFQKYSGQAASLLFSQFKQKTLRSGIILLLQLFNYQQRGHIRFGIKSLRARKPVNLTISIAQETRKT
jgi:hypothetical protein